MPPLKVANDDEEDDRVNLSHEINPGMTKIEVPKLRPPAASKSLRVEKVDLRAPPNDSALTWKSRKIKKKKQRRKLLEDKALSEKEKDGWAITNAPAEFVGGSKNEQEGLLTEQSPTENDILGIGKTAASVSHEAILGTAVTSSPNVSVTRAAATLRLRVTLPPWPTPSFNDLLSLVTVSSPIAGERELQLPHWVLLAVGISTVEWKESPNRNTPG
ncbi:unnamed protein product [Linum trigynum]|uniref:Uncharacterized protein n=1 Tax=Linum trigynum TaxID=586398 RepID=A0AAV2FEK7_9ROSI